MTEKRYCCQTRGTEGVDFSAICQDAAGLLAKGQRLVLVHGGSAEANQLGEALGYPPRFITSLSGYTSRYTDRRTLEIFAMSVNGKGEHAAGRTAPEAECQRPRSERAGWTPDGCNTPRIHPEH